MKTLIASYTTLIPLGVWGVLMVFFVWTNGLRRRVAAGWSLGLLAVCLKFHIARLAGGHAFYPELPQALVCLLDWAYYGAFLLALLAVVFVWWRRPAKLWVLPAAAWTLSALGLWAALASPRAREVTLAYPDLPPALDGYRIAQVTDIHCSSEARRARTAEIVRRVNALDADLVCLLGDNVDGSVAARFDDLAPLADLRARDGVWCVTGNHEYYNDSAAWFAAYERLGLHFLTNSCVFPRPGLALGGVNDFEAANIRYRRAPRDFRAAPARFHPFWDRPDTARAFAAATNGCFRVLLQHQPRFARLNAARHNVRLQLSGHTHGGYLPVIRGVVARFNQGFVRGTYDIGGPDGAAYLSLSSGAGQSAGIMVRFFTPPDITLITLRRTPAR